ncbi:MAG: hypothetical protein ACFE9R_05525 [Candidatus Hermodarchaeota archaeon]
MSNFNYEPTYRPTFYYIGTSTSKSSIIRVFPKWAEYLGISSSDSLEIIVPQINTINQPDIETLKEKNY